MLNTIFFIFVVIIIIQIIYYLFIFSNFTFTKKVTKKNFNKPVSIIICAKNEAENLKTNLPFIANQTYQNFEIILVNDHSTDNTLNIMLDFKNKSKNINTTIINLNNNKSNKKQALTNGINASNNKYLLLTDADCKPNSPNWISDMSQQFNSTIKIILGYGAYQKINGSWLNKLIRFETLLTAIQYFSYTKIGLPYMGVGRNIAYTKNTFNLANGFTKHHKIKSGDDDLFINQIATNKNTTICFTKNSFTISKPHISFKKWLLQKRRHISTANHYKSVHKLLLGLFYLSQFLFWVLTFLLLISGFNTKIVFELFLIRLLFQYIIVGFSAKKLNETDLIVYLPLLELFLITVQLRIFIQNLIKKPTHW